MTDYEHMLISALRYALGRRTYIVEITMEYIEAEIPKLSEQCTKIMIGDILQQENMVMVMSATRQIGCTCLRN